jgi:hypothetical protein
MGRPWLVHAVADCRDCDFSEHDYKIAVQKGRQHAKKTGHCVIVETGYCQIYNDDSSVIKDI